MPYFDYWRKSLNNGLKRNIVMTWGVSVSFYSVCVTEKCTGVSKAGNILLETDMTHHAEQYRVLSRAMTLPLCLIKQVLLLMNTPGLTMSLVVFLINLNLWGIFWRVRMPTSLTILWMTIFEMPFPCFCLRLQMLLNGNTRPIMFIQ